MIKFEPLTNILTLRAKLTSLLMFMMMHPLASMGSVCKMTFWNIQQKGANIFNKHITEKDIKAAKRYGIKFIRLAPDKFISAHRDFLMGNADDYRGLMKEDLDHLKKILDMFHKEGIPVVLTLLSLPGCRWKQHHHQKNDLRIWTSEKHQAQAAHFWQQLAAALKDHPAIVGYNIMNEPRPERVCCSKGPLVNPLCQERVQKTLYHVYDRIIKSIRQVDKDTPIILDSSACADAQTFHLLIPHKDPNVLYSFHMYEPYEYTDRHMNKKNFPYPGCIHGKQWNCKALIKYMFPVIAFQKIHNIPRNRIFVGEFGGHRMSFGLEKYFKDLIEIFNKQGWHFAFYAFREDTWEGMDYEVGPGKLPWHYWKAIDAGKKPELKRKSTYPAFQILEKALKEGPS